MPPWFNILAQPESMSGQGKLRVEVGGALVQPTLLTRSLPIVKPTSYGFFFLTKKGGSLVFFNLLKNHTVS